MSLLTVRFCDVSPSSSRTDAWFPYPKNFLSVCQDWQMRKVTCHCQVMGIILSSYHLRQLFSELVDFVIYVRYNQQLVCFSPTVIGSSIQCMYIPLLRGFGWHFAVLNHRTIPKYSMDWTVVKNMLGQLKVVMSGSQTVLLPSCSDGKSSSQ